MLRCTIIIETEGIDTEKPSVTKRYTYIFWIGVIGLALCLGLGIASLRECLPEERLEIAICVAILSLFSLASVALGLCREVLDESGIRTEFLRWTWFCCAWSEIREVAVVTRPGTRAIGDTWLICITGPKGVPYRVVGRRWTVKNLLTGYILDYQKNIWECILFYYGQPDIDECGKPPRN